MKTLPVEFTERMQHQLGYDAYNEFIHSLNITAPVSIRVNPGKFRDALAFERVSWCDTGYYLPERPVFVADPLWHAGTYYVQEASSMAIEQAFKTIRERYNGQLSVLDLCAAPGGKSTHIASLLSENDVLVSNEVIRTRVPVLNENLCKWGYPNVIITNSDSKDFEQCAGLFDVIVVDAPCSGEGLFRKDENAIDEWSVANTEICTLRQKRILDQITRCLKPGGYIIYSTCTYNPDENEKQVDALRKKGFTPVIFQIDSGKSATYQFFPHFTKGEGFFIALLQKEEGITAPQETKKANIVKRIKDSSAFSSFIKTTSNFIEFRDHIVALNNNTLELLEKLQPAINIYSVGMRVCEKNDKLVVPSAYLPFSFNFNETAFETKSLDMDEALSYLSKNALPHQTKNKGYVCLQFGKINIGLGKLAGNRINNLFPNEWRLRKTIKPEEYFSLGNFIK